MGKEYERIACRDESHSSLKFIYVSRLSSQLAVLSSRVLLSPLNQSNVEMSR